MCRDAPFRRRRLKWRSEKTEIARPEKETTKKENTVERDSVTLEIFSWLGDGARGGRPRAARMGSSCRELCGRSFDDVRRERTELKK